MAAYGSLTYTLANVIVEVDPARAHTLAPRDGHITAAAAQLQFTLKPEPDSRSEAGRLARLALKQDATAAEALTVLGFQAQLRNDTEQARQLFTYSLTLTRRELQPRLWAIEDAVARGDIDGALASYDLALRTSRRAPELLFPVLSMAIAEPKIRSALIPIVNDETPWAEDFIHYLAIRAPDPRPVVPFFRQGELADLPISDEDRTQVVNALVVGGHFDEAWRYYSSFRRVSDRRRSRDPGFSGGVEIPAAFDWTPTNDGALSAVIVTNEGGGLVDFHVPPSVGGVLMEQLQVLPPGPYRLVGRSAGIEQSESALPYWTLTCGDGRELGRVTVPNSAQANGSFTGRFTVPSGCPVQRLALRARLSDQITGVTGQLLRAELVPADEAVVRRRAR